MKYKYSFEKDIKFICELTGYDISDVCEHSSVSKRNVLYSFKNEPSNNTLEKVYSFIYSQNCRLSLAKSEIFKENLKNNEMLFFHGSKYGFEEIDYKGSKSDSDFSNGFYCSDNIDSAISFVENCRHSSVYAFKANVSKLTSYEFNCDLDWMLAISYYRGRLKEYKDCKFINNIIKKIDKADLIIAPIADNKMFEVLNKFVDGEISSTQALHSLSASRLGKQYVFKNKKAISSLEFIDRFYLCDEERKYSKLLSIDNSNIIQTKLDLARREYRNEGKFIDEIFE